MSYNSQDSIRARINEIFKSFHHLHRLRYVSIVDIVRLLWHVWRSYGLGRRRVRRRVGTLTANFLVILSMLLGLLGITPSSVEPATAIASISGSGTSDTNINPDQSALAAANELPSGQITRSVPQVTDPHLPSLIVNMNITPSTVAVGEPFTVTLTVSNQAADPATNLNVTLPLPNGAGRQLGRNIINAQNRGSQKQETQEKPGTGRSELHDSHTHGISQDLAPKTTGNTLDSPTDTPVSATDTPTNVPTDTATNTATNTATDTVTDTTATSTSTSTPPDPSSTPTPDPNVWTWTQPQLDGGSSATFTATMYLVQTPPGDAILATAQATADGLDASIQETGGAIVVDRSLMGPSSVLYSPSTTSTLQSMDGHIQVDIPADAADRDLTLQQSYQPESGQTEPPSITGGKTGFGTFYLTATDDQGNPFRQFSAPLTVTMSYTPEQLRALGISSSDVSLFWYDDTSQDGNGPQWRLIDTDNDTSDPSVYTATVHVDHFTDFKLSDGSAPSAAYIPSLQGWQVGLYTGDVSYQFPIDVPAGPGGMKPNVQLSYGSTSSDGGGGTREKQQSGWVGKDWSLDTGYVGLNRIAGAGGLSRYYSLVFDGQSFDLVRGDPTVTSPSLTDPTDWEWHPTNESFIRASAVSNGDSTSTRGAFTSGGDPVPRYKWQVWAKNGTRYDFEEDAWQGWDECASDSRVSYETYKWYLTRVVDSNGNTINYNYDRKSEDSGSPPSLCGWAHGIVDESVWPTSITWGSNPDASNYTDRYKVEFITQTRTIDTDGEQVSNSIKKSPYEVAQLNAIKVWSKQSSSWELVRQYNLGYETDNTRRLLTDKSISIDDTTWYSDTGFTKITLKSITRVGKDGSGALPSTTFTYGEHISTEYNARGTDYYPRASWNRLTKVDNGYGGTITFNYESIGDRLDGDPDFHGHPIGGGYDHNIADRYRNNRRITSKVVTDGLGHSYTWSYDYSSGTPALNSLGSYSALGSGSDGPNLYPTSASLYYAKFSDSTDRKSELIHPRNSEFRGHSYVIETDPNGNVTEHWFYQGDGQVVDTSDPSNTVCNYPGYAEYGDHHPMTGVYAITHNSCFVTLRKQEFLKGKEYKTVTHQGGATGPKLSENKNTYTMTWYSDGHDGYADDSYTGLWRAFVGDYQVSSRAWDSNTVASLNMTTTNLYDGYGNVIDAVESDDSGMLRTTAHSYNVVSDTTHYIVDHKRSDNIFDSQNHFLAKTVYSYDGTYNATIGAVGNLTLQRKYYDIPLVITLPTTINSSDTSFVYDHYGNMTATVTYAGPGQLTTSGPTYTTPGNGSIAMTTTTKYDDVFHALPVEIDQPALSSGLVLTQTAGYDLRMGTMTSIHDPNDKVTSATYDIYGRMSAMAKPGDSDDVPTEEYIYGDNEYLAGGRPFSYEQRQWYIDPHGGGRWFKPTYSFYDGMGRKIQTRSSTQICVKIIVTDYQYDGLGQTTGQSQPREVITGTCSAPDYTFQRYSAPGPEVLWTHSTYDGVGRATQIQAPDNTDTIMQYALISGSRVVTTTDAKGHENRNDSDMFGRLLRVKEFSGNAHGGSEGSIALYSTTSYAYSPLDLLTSATDNASNTTTMQYDSLGRKVAMTDTAMGLWSYQYDVNGNLSVQVDNKAQTIYFYYDNLNRLSSEQNYLADSSYDGSRVFQYDASSSSNYGKGQRTDVKRYDADDTVTSETQYQYNRRGQQIQEDYSVLGLSGTRTFTQTYDNGDRLISMGYPNGEVVSYTYDGAWRQASVCTSLAGGCYATAATYTALGQPIHWSLGNGLAQTYSYDSTMQRLSELQVGPSSTPGTPGSLFDRTYTYDNVGNVATITNTLTSEGQGFSYDHRDRLIKWTLDPGTSNTASTEDYSYNEIGNILSKGPTSSPSTYTYGTGHGGPSAVHSAGGVSYAYDGNGNMTSMTGGAGRSFTWNVENQPSEISVSTPSSVTEDYLYDADGTRVKRTVTGGSNPGTTYYLGGLYEEDSTNNKTRNLYQFNGQIIAQREWSPDPTNTPTPIYSPTRTNTPVATNTPTRTPTNTPIPGAYHHLDFLPVGSTMPSIPISNVITATLGDRLDFNLNLKAGLNSIDAHQVSLTFDNNLLQNVNATATAGTCVITNTLTPDITYMDTTIQNEVCNGPGTDPCVFTYGGIGHPASAGTISFASGTLGDPVSGHSDFRVAQVSFCAISTGEALIHWQFSPPEPTNRDTKILNSTGTDIADQSSYGDLIVVITSLTPTPTPKNSSTPTRTPTITNTPTVTNTPASGSALLVGHVTWQGISQPNTNNISQTITLTLKVGTTEVNYPSQNTDASGFFTANVSSLASGLYSWRVKGPKNLANSGTVTLTGASSLQQEMNTLLAGDANNNNGVSILDFNILKNAFGGTCRNGTDMRADFNNDCVTNVQDFTLLKLNFGAGGAGPLGPQHGGVSVDGYLNSKSAVSAINANEPATSKTNKIAKGAELTPTVTATFTATPVAALIQRVPNTSNINSKPQSGSSTRSGTNIYAPDTVNAVVYFHGDHLGSVSMVTGFDAHGQPTVVSQQDFDPWGKVRSGGISETTRNYTGQKLDDTALLYYGARFYDPSLARFISPDTAEPDSKDPQSRDRYSYVLNNPLGYVDHSGHRPVGPGINPPKLGGPNKDIGNYSEMVHSMFTTLDYALKDPTFTLLQGSTRNLADTASWGFKVCGGCEWDASKGIKDMYQSGDKDLYFSAGGKTEIAHQLFGNILFGFLGAGIGFTPDDLKTQGDLFDTVTDFKGPNTADQNAINFGMSLWAEYNGAGKQITEEDLAREIEKYIETNKVHTRASLQACKEGQEMQWSEFVESENSIKTHLLEACNGW